MTRKISMHILLALLIAMSSRLVFAADMTTVSPPNVVPHTNSNGRTPVSGYKNIYDNAYTQYKTYSDSAGVTRYVRFRVVWPNLIKDEYKWVGYWQPQAPVYYNISSTLTVGRWTNTWYPGWGQMNYGYQVSVTESGVRYEESKPWKGRGLVFCGWVN